MVKRTEQRTDESKKPDFPEGGGFVPDMFISGVNTPFCVQLLINKPEFVLGKSETCDGLLAFNDEISRDHCKIIWRAGQYFISDLNSTNGTFLNDEMLVPNQEYPICPGNRLRLSASTFLIEQIFSARSC